MGFGAKGVLRTDLLATCSALLARIEQHSWLQNQNSGLVGFRVLGFRAWGLGPVSTSKLGLIERLGVEGSYCTIWVRDVGNSKD